MNTKTPEEIGAKMDALNLWEAVLPFNWAVKPSGTAIPYFCTVLRGDGQKVKIRFLMLEGWQTFHDYIHTGVDRNFGYYLTPMEMPHFELVVDHSGAVSVFRNNPGYLPRDLDGREKELCSKILWESYGVMMRMESEEKLPLSFASEKSMFARIEESGGNWVDAPLVIPEPRPFVEQIAIPKELVNKAKDLPLDPSVAVEIDFRLLFNVMTREDRPRCAYKLMAIEEGTQARVVDQTMSVAADFSLKAMWLSIPSRLLTAFVERGKIPGQIKVTTGRLFRILRPIGIEFPVKLSLHDKLDLLNEAFKPLGK